MATIKELKANGAPRFKVPGKEEIYDAFDQFLAENFLGETVEAIPAAPANSEFAPQAVALYAIANTGKGNAGLWKAGTGTSSKNWDLSFLQGILNQFSTLPAATRGKTVSEIKEQLEDFASKKFAKNPANARNGLLHLCNPNIYAPIYSFADSSPRTPQTPVTDFCISATQTSTPRFIHLQTNSQSARNSLACSKTSSFRTVGTAAS